MRIALATRYLSDATSVTAVGGLGRALSARGHEIVLITAVAPAGQARARLGVPCWAVPGRDLATQLGRLLTKERFDHVHLRIGGSHQNPLVWGLERIAKAGASGVSLQFDDFDNPDLPREDAKTAHAIRILLRERRMKVSAISTAVRDRVCNRWRIPLRRVPVIATGVDFSSAPRDQGRNILCVGRLSPYKGLDLVLFAFAGMSKSFPGKLVFAGYGTKDPYLSGLAAQLGVTARVQLLGLVSHDRLRHLLSSSRFLVMGSRWEALGLSGLEAMAAARPIIAPRLGGFLDFVVPGRNGLLFEPQDPASLERAIRELVDRPARVRAMSRAARKTAWAFRWPAIAERYLRFWSA